MTSKTSTERMRCPECRKRTLHSIELGPRQADPDHRKDRTRDFHTVEYRCSACGRVEHTKRYPDLLSRFFHRTSDE